MLAFGLSEELLSNDEKECFVCRYTIMRRGNKLSDDLLNFR